MKSAICAAGLALLMSGCETPPEALGTARHTAGMVGMLEVELATFKAEQTSVSKQRLEIIREHEATVLTVSNGLDRMEIFKAAAGSTKGHSELARLQRLAKAIEDADVAAQTRTRQMTERVNKVLAPLSDTKGSSRAAIAAIGAMSVELDLSDRVKEFKAAAENVKATVDDLKTNDTAKDPAGTKP